MDTTIENIQQTLHEIGQKARQATQSLALVDAKIKHAALHAIANTLDAEQKTILEANQLDLTQAQQQGRTTAFLDRLTLNHGRIKQLIEGVRAIAELDDPVGRVLSEWNRPNGLHISKISVPLGVIGVIYESRPNVTADAAALCLKSGNAVILRSGSESFHSSQAIMHCITKGLVQIGLPKDCVQMIPFKDRAAVAIMIKMDDAIDVLIPRGGQSLIKYLSKESCIPLFKHLHGICHTYIHQDANPEMACDIVVNAKMRRPGICGATETLLIDKAIIASHLPPIIDQLIDAQCELRGDTTIVELDPRVKPAVAADWDTEYLDAILSIKSVEHIEAAITHINQHSSLHTDAIITDNPTAATKFLSQINSAIIMHNCSTQFADGGEFGMGAEIGISTGKLHARGPVGVEQLTTFKYWVEGQGQIRP